MGASNQRSHLQLEVDLQLEISPPIRDPTSNWRWDLQSEISPPIGDVTSNWRSHLLEVFFVPSGVTTILDYIKNKRQKWVGSYFTAINCHNRRRNCKLSTSRFLKKRKDVESGWKIVGDISEMFQHRSYTVMNYFLTTLRYLISRTKKERINWLKWNTSTIWCTVFTGKLMPLKSVKIRKCTKELLTLCQIQLSLYLILNGKKLVHGTCGDLSNDLGS